MDASAEEARQIMAMKRQLQEMRSTSCLVLHRGEECCYKREQQEMLKQIRLKELRASAYLPMTEELEKAIAYTVY